MVSCSGSISTVVAISHLQLFLCESKGRVFCERSIKFFGESKLIGCFEVKDETSANCQFSLLF